MKKLITALPVAFILLLGCAESTEKAETDHPVASSNTVETEKVEKHTRMESWDLDPSRSNITYSVTNFGKPVDGTIGGLKGTVQFDKDNPGNGLFETSVKVSTIDTDNTKRDKDLMKEKYFNEPEFPDIVFKSTKISKDGNGYRANGELTIKGISRPLEMPFEFKEDGNTGVFSSQFTINRHDYNIGGNGPILGDDIKVNLKVVAEKDK